MSYSAKSLLFDGSNDHVTMGNVLDFAHNVAFSLVGWAKFTATTGVLWGKQAGATTYTGYAVYTASGKFGFMLSNDHTGGNFLDIQTVPATYNDGAWHSVILTWNGTVSQVAANAKFYIDGALVTDADLTDNLTASSSNAASFEIADTTLWPAPLAGNVDGVAVYNKELVVGEVWQIWNGGWPTDLTDARMPSNLVGFWRMGDGDTFPTISDNSGSGFHGTMTNMDAGDIVDDAPNPWEFDYTAPPAGFEMEAVWAAPPMSTAFMPVGGPATKYYKMRAQDDGVALPGYVTWVAQDTPDFAGVGFSGGTPTPVGSMIAGSATVVAEWEE
jgi:hypothetical protein